MHKILLMVTAATTSQESAMSQSTISQSTISPSNVLGQRSGARAPAPRGPSEAAAPRPRARWSARVYAELVRLLSQMAVR
jgi:hypothetical protein